MGSVVQCCECVAQILLAAEQLRAVASGANPRNDIQQMSKAPEERRNGEVFGPLTLYQQFPVTDMGCFLFGPV